MASGIGMSESDVICESSLTDLDLTISALAACTSGSSVSVFTKSFVSINEAGRVPYIFSMENGTLSASSSTVFFLRKYNEILYTYDDLSLIWKWGYSVLLTLVVLF